MRFFALLGPESVCAGMRGQRAAKAMSEPSGFASRGHHCHWDHCHFSCHLESDYFFLLSLKYVCCSTLSGQHPKPFKEPVLFDGLPGTTRSGPYTFLISSPRVRVPASLNFEQFEEQNTILLLTQGLDVLTCPLLRIPVV